MKANIFTRWFSALLIALTLAPMAQAGVIGPPTAPATLASIDVSGRMTPNCTSCAAANAAALQAAINTANTNVSGKNVVSVNVPGVYYLQQVVMPSNTELDVGSGVTLRKAASYLAAMFINYGALQGSPSTDSNITITGAGTIDGNSANQSGLTQATVASPTVNTFLYGFQAEIAMVGVNNFTLSGVTIYNCNGFGLQWIGQGLRVENVTANTARDFIHINGPSSHVVIRNVTGYSSDVFIALNAWDWHRSGPTVGDITDVRVEGVAYFGSNNVDGLSARTSGLIVFLPGTRTTGAGQGVGNVKNVSVDGFVLDPTRGTVTANSAGIQPSMAKDTFNGSEYSGAGIIENVKISNGYIAVPNSNSPAISLVSQNISADGQATVTVRNFLVENVHFDASPAAAGANINTAATTFNFWYVENLRFKDCEWTPSSGSGGQSFLNWGNKTPADSVAIDGLVINPNTGTGQIQAALVGQYTAGVASVINDLTLDRIMTAPGYQHANPWLTVNGVITNLRSRGNYIVGSGAGSDIQGILLSSTTAQIVNGVISDGYFNGTKELVTVNSAAANAVTLSVQNSVLNNVTHPVFLNAGVTADISFRGSSINTGNNLARLSNASGTLNLSFVDTTSSGTGAAVISAAAAGTLRVRNTDRIQAPAALTATNPPTPSNNDLVNFAATPSYTGSVVISGTGAGLYVYRGTGTVGWVKLN